MNKPRVNSEGQKELDKAQEQFDSFTQTINAKNAFDPMAKIESQDPQTLLSRKEIKNADIPYIKPIRSIARTNFKSDKTDGRSYFKEEHKAQHDKDWEYVKCIVENYECIGDAVEAWTSKWGCDPAHLWKVPVNKPVWIPRLLAEQLANCKYMTHTMGNPHDGKNYFDESTGKFVVDTVKHRIDARPVGFGF